MWWGDSSVKAFCALCVCVPSCCLVLVRALDTCHHHVGHGWIAHQVSAIMKLCLVSILAQTLNTSSRCCMYSIAVYLWDAGWPITMATEERWHHPTAAKGVLYLWWALPPSLPLHRGRVPLRALQCSWWTLIGHAHLWKQGLVYWDILWYTMIYCDIL